MRQNSSMDMNDRPRRRLSSWLMAAALAVSICGAIAAADGIACDQFAKRFATSPANQNRQARLLDGTLCRDNECTPAVLVQGVLSDRTVEAVLQRAAAMSNGDLWVCLDSPGGAHSVSAIGPLPRNVKTCLADIVDKPGQAPREALCASACAWLWLAGSYRMVFGANHVGFHRPYIYDSAACAPGNAMKAAEGLVLGWIRDRAEHRYDEQMHAARHELRLLGLGMGPTEAYYVDAGHARAAGLQTGEPTTAVFRIAGEAAQVASK